MSKILPYAPSPVGGEGKGEGEGGTRPTGTEGLATLDTSKLMELVHTLYHYSIYHGQGFNHSGTFVLDTGHVDLLQSMTGLTHAVGSPSSSLQDVREVPHWECKFGKELVCAYRPMEVTADGSTAAFMPANVPSAPSSPSRRLSSLRARKRISTSSEATKPGEKVEQLKNETTDAALAAAAAASLAGEMAAEPNSPQSDHLGNNVRETDTPQLHMSTNAALSVLKMTKHIKEM
ncbi:unnamed protein product, partial [Chrysoparadoxa australica]